MSTQMRALLGSGLDDLRYEPIGKRIRAVLGDETVVDSTQAMLVWEPRRIVPSYAVPVGDVRGELSPAAAAAPLVLATE
jgi:phage baseplate assembly protein W